MVANAEGKNLSLTQLGEFVDRITDFYHNHKYPLTRAIIRAQTIQAGVVHIEAIEVRYDKITLDNHSSASDSLLQHILSPLKGGQPIEENALDHVLLLVSDIPGVAATTTLKPGTAAATSDLIVETTATPAMTGTVVADQNSSLSLALSGQWANANLDSSDKLVAGGAYTVRAYDMSAVSGDSGALANIEYRYALGQLWQGQSQAVLFIDSAHVTINQTVWAPGMNSAILSGASVGLNWLGADQWSAKAYVATPIGSTPELVGMNKSARAWIEIDKGF